MPPVPQLTAIHEHGEILRNECGDQRPSISLTVGSNLMLGKNSTTGIADMSVRRKVATITAVANTSVVHLRVVMGGGAPPAAGIRVNGLVPAMPVHVLQHGDIVTLLCANAATGTSYAYRLDVPSQSNNNNKKRKQTATTTTSATTAPSTSLEDEIMCPICLEIMVKSTLLVRV